MAAVTVTQNSPSEFQRPPINAADADASAIPPWSLGPAKGFRLGATCDKPNATLALRLYFLDGNGRIISVASISFSASSTPDWGVTYVGIPSVESWWPTLGAKNLVMKVDMVSAGSTWNVAGAWGE